MQNALNGMTRRVNGLLIMAIALIALTSVVGAQAPKPAARPNFGGAWVFDPDATKISADAVQMNGLALFTETFTAEQDEKAFTMHVDLGPVIVTAIYKLDGSVSKNMSPPSVPMPPRSRSRPTPRGRARRS